MPVSHCTALRRRNQSVAVSAAPCSPYCLHLLAACTLARHADTGHAPGQLVGHTI